MQRLKSAVFCGLISIYCALIPSNQNTYIVPWMILDGVFVLVNKHSKYWIRYLPVSSNSDPVFLFRFLHEFDPLRKSVMSRAPGRGNFGKPRIVPQGID